MHDRALNVQAQRRALALLAVSDIGLISRHSDCDGTSSQSETDLPDAVVVDIPDVPAKTNIDGRSVAEGAAPDLLQPSHTPPRCYQPTASRRVCSSYLGYLMA